MKKDENSKRKIDLWQKRLSTNQSKYDTFAAEFDRREALFKGDHSVEPCCDGDTKTETTHVRNIVAELIESQVDTAIPMPKVKARNKEDEGLAKIIEDMIIDELDRLPIEELNDMMERTVPLQGGSLFWVEWDHFLRTHNTTGEITLKTLHPAQIVPQDGVFTCIEDMDYIIVKLPQTKEYIKRRYGVDVHAEGEEEPEIRGAEASEAAGLVTQYIAYFRNDRNGIGLFSWVNDIVLEDLEDYQARRLRKCKKCGAVEPVDTVPLDEPSLDGKHPKGESGEEEQYLEEDQPRSGGHKTKCPYCGSTQFEDSEEEYELVMMPKTSAHGVMIPGMVDKEIVNEFGVPEVMPVPTKIPYYKPDVYPIILQKNVSVHGQLLGDSDVDKISDQQNSLNRLSAKMMDKLLKVGSFVTLPPDATIRTDNEDMKYIRLENAADKAMIDVFDTQGNIEQDMAWYRQIYEEARQVIGITDSFQGRQDPTATSGKAKEFAAQQSAGRLESKRVMKEATYQVLYEVLFKFKLAYADEPRSIVSKNERGETQYEVFDRYDFLRQDEAGEWYWNDQFIFSVDSSTPLAKDREAMWQELRMNLQTGAFGNPQDMRSLIIFWTKMDEQHYPGAADVKKMIEQIYAEQKLEQQQMMAQQQQMQMAAASADADARAAEAEAKAVENIMKGGAKNGNQKTKETPANK